MSETPGDDAAATPVSIYGRTYQLRGNENGDYLVDENGEEQGAYYIAMEYAPGGDLHELVKRRQGRQLPLADALHIIGEVCGGLQFAHALAGPDGELLGVEPLRLGLFLHQA